MYKIDWFKYIFTVILIGCVPISAGPPPVPMGQNIHNEIGGANNMFLRGTEIGPDLWYRHRLSDKTEFYIQTGANIGYGIFPYLGGGYRRHLIGGSQHSKYNLDLEFGGGAMIWGQVAAPMSLKLGPTPIWLTSQPALSLNYMGLINLPIGLSAKLKNHFSINLQAGTRLFRGYGSDGSSFYWNAGASFPF
jgi:hypothetical protein